MGVSSHFRAVLRRLLAALGQIFSRSLVLMDGVFYSAFPKDCCVSLGITVLHGGEAFGGGRGGTSSEMIGKGGLGASGPSPMEQHLGPGPPQARVQHSPQT